MKKLSMGREEELKNKGWGKRFTIEESRINEIKEQYEELGFEVLIETPENLSEGCMECNHLELNRYKTIYTRRKN